MTIRNNRSKAINLIVHMPKTTEGMQELAHRKAEVHADLANQYIKMRSAPEAKKHELLEAVIAQVKAS